MVMGISTWVRKPQVFPTLDQAVATIVKLRSDHPLKVEVSYRNTRIAPENVRMIRRIRVYSVDALANMKARAYLGRDKLITGFLELNERLGLQSATDGGEGRSTPSP